MAQTSLYRLIRDSLTEEGLPSGFSLPARAEEESIWAVGAQDGVYLYHMLPQQLLDAERAMLASAVLAENEGKQEEADRRFAELTRRVRAVALVEPMQDYIVAHADRMSPEHVLTWSTRNAMESDNSELVKLALTQLSMLSVDSGPLRAVVRTLGQCDEFTLFVMMIMQNWPDGNDEIFALAQRLHGWGRIHAVEQLEPAREEIARWLLTDGWRNNVAEYSALTCWQKCGAEELLLAGADDETFACLSDMMGELLTDGPTAGLSALDDPEGALRLFVTSARGRALTQSERETLAAVAALEGLPEDLAVLSRALLES